MKRIKTEADLAEALDNPRKPDPMDAIRYGNFFGEHGISHRLYQSAGFLSGTYRGVDLNAPVSTLKDLARRIIRRVA